MQRDTSNDVDRYIAESTNWPEVMTALRPVLLGCGLSEQLKWNKPCFGTEGANIVIMQEMKDVLALMFFKGMLLDDIAGVLEPNGPNSRSARRMCFASVADVERLTDTVVSYVAEAVQLEVDGIEVGPPPELELVEELQARLDGDAELKAAFDALTPGRRREYHLHISGAKQASTRESRVDSCVPKILNGKGFRQR
ncbi:MAG: YdeI/OmpD-associated family protein [Ilumatobacter sp.]|uniref:YdeI/OmpD-associated family protein n=1 Tax=Ilumatobacter sp. TaxID=1967498 RepID=UPI00329A12BB